MSDNPYAAPGPGMPGDGSGQAGTEAAMQKVATPAMALLVVGVLNLLLYVWGIASSAMLMAGVFPGMAEQAQQMEDLRQQAGDNPAIEWVIKMQEYQQGPAGLIMNIVCLLLAVVTILGAMKMKKLQSRGLAMAGAIIAIIPCLSCCMYGVPVGIWALVVLMAADVKAAFRK